MLTILLANRFYKPYYGGVENSLYYLSKIFQEKGCQSIILTSNKNDITTHKLPAYEEKDGVLIYRYKALGKIAGKFAFLLFIEIVRIKYLIHKIEKKHKVSFIVTRDHITGYGCKKALRNIYTIYLPPGVVIYQNKLDKMQTNANMLIRLLKEMKMKITYMPIQKYYQKQMINIADQVLVLSDNMKTQIYSVYNSLERKIDTINPGVDCRKYNKSRDRSIDRAKHNISQTTFVALMICRINPSKGIDISIRAVSLLKNIDIKLIIVGEGKDSVYLKQLAACLGVSSKVLFAGYSNIPERYYKIADIFLMTSRYEPFGQTILEAMASCLPVIAFRNSINTITASQEILNDGITGFLCNDNPESLSEKINEIYNAERIKLIEVGNNAREVVRRIYSWEHTSEVLKEYYFQHLNKKSNV